MSIRLLILLFAVFSLPLHAASIQPSDLPSTIQSCPVSSCVVYNTSTYDSGTMAAFHLYQNNGVGYDSNWLIRYTLAPPSGQSRINPSQSDAFTGYLWMKVQDSYSAAERAHPLTLYLDKVSPAPFTMFGQTGDLSLAMNTSDLVAGSAYRTYGLDYNNNSYDYGHLMGETPVPCVASGCETRAMLNLTQLIYQDFGSTINLASFNSTDTRGLVFKQSSTYSCNGDPSCAMDDRQGFYVQAVPIPSALILLFSGAMIFGTHLMRSPRRLT